MKSEKAKIIALVILFDMSNEIFLCLSSWKDIILMVKWRFSQKGTLSGYK